MGDLQFMDGLQWKTSSSLVHFTSWSIFGAPKKKLVMVIVHLKQKLKDYFLPIQDWNATFTRSLDQLAKSRKSQHFAGIFLGTSKREP